MNKTGKKLIILQKRITRIIYWARPKEHTDPLFEKNGTYIINEFKQIFDYRIRVSLQHQIRSRNILSLI